MAGVNVFLLLNTMLNNLLDSVAQPGFGGGGTGGLVGGTRGLGNGGPPVGSRGRVPGGWFGGIASRKLIAVFKDI